MADWRYRVIWPSYTGGALNPAIVSFLLTSTIDCTPEYAAHRLVAYCSSVGEQVSGLSNISDVLLSIDGGPDTPVLWDSDIWDEIKANESDDYPVSATMSYGVDFGSGSMTIRGASVNVAEYTERGGKHNGRHYLPWIDAAALDGNGDLLGARRNYIAGAWTYYVRGDVGSSNPYDCYLGPSVPVTNPSGVSLITTVSVRPVVSRLRSRTR